MEFGERLKAARLKKGLKQRELAAIIKSTNTALSNWEHNISTPTASVIKLLAEALDCNPFDLLGEYNMHEVQELEKKPAAERNSTEKAVLVFANEIIQEMNMELRDGIKGVAAELASLGIADVIQTAMKTSQQKLLSDGGQEMLYAYNTLNAEGKVMAINHIIGLLKVPSFLEEPIYGSEQEIQKLTEVKKNLNGG